MFFSICRRKDFSSPFLGCDWPAWLNPSMKMDKLITKGATEQSVELFGATALKYKTWVSKTSVIVERSQLLILKTSTIRLQQSSLRFTYVLYHHWIIFLQFSQAKKKCRHSSLILQCTRHSWKSWSKMLKSWCMLVVPCKKSQFFSYLKI